MTVLDWTLLAIIGFFLIRGLFRGFLLELFEIIVLVAGYMAASFFGPQLGAFASNLTGMNRFLSGALSFVIIFVLTAVALGYLAILLRKAVRAAQLGWLDRSGGGLLATMKALIAILIGLLLFSFLPLSTKTENFLANGAVSGKAWFVISILHTRLGLSPVSPETLPSTTQITLSKDLPGTLNEEAQKAILTLVPGASTQSMADVMRAWGLNDEIVHIVTDNLDLMRSILLQTPKDSGLPVEDIAKGDPALDLPDKLGITEQQQETIVAMLENADLNPEEKGKQFWTLITPPTE